MRFEAEHHFAGSPAAVGAILTDPDFYTALELPDVGAAEVLDSMAEGGRSRLRLRYEFTGSLDAAARRLLGPHRLAWIQELTMDQASGSGELTFQAQADPKRLYGSAHFALEPSDAGCVRRLAGELVVAVPLIGTRAEERIVPGITRRLDIEAKAVNAAMARGQR